MLTGHGDDPAICRQEDSSRRRQPFSFLRYSGWRARRRLSRPPHPAQARPTPLMLLPSIPGLSTGIALLFSLFYPHAFCGRLWATAAGVADAISTLGTKQSLTYRTAVMTCGPD